MIFLYIDNVPNTDDKFYGMFLRDCIKFINIKPLSKYSNESACLLIEINHWRDSPDFIENIVKTYSNFNNLLFVLCDTSEGYPTKYLYYPFFEMLEKYNIQKNRRIFMYNNSINANNKLKEYEKFYTLYYPSFLYEFAMASYSNTYNTINCSKYDYSCFNRNVKHHKTDIVKKILDYNLNCAITYDLYERTDFTDNKFLKFKDLSENAYLDDELYFLGKVNILVESEYYNINHKKCPSEGIHQFDEFIHLSEKTFRNILFGIPYVMVGNRYSLTELRRLGFKTFDSIIDESYDTMDDSIRMDMSLKSAGELLKVYDSNEVQSILTYNKNHLNTFINNYEFFNNTIINPLKDLV